MMMMGGVVRGEERENLSPPSRVMSFDPAPCAISVCSVSVIQFVDLAVENGQSETEDRPGAGMQNGDRETWRGEV